MLCSVAEFWGGGFAEREEVEIGFAVPNVTSVF